MAKAAPKKPGRPALPPDQVQTAMIRERVTETQRVEYEARGGKVWLVAALNRKRKGRNLTQKSPAAESRPRGLTG